MNYPETVNFFAEGHEKAYEKAPKEEALSGLQKPIRRSDEVALRAHFFTPKTS